MPIQRFVKSRSRWKFPAFPEHRIVFCGDWGRASTSRNPHFHFRRNEGGWRPWPRKHCLRLLYQIWYNEYQYKIFLLLMVPLPDPRNDMGEVLNIECRTSIELLLIYPMAVSEASGMPILVIQSVEKEVGLFVCS